MFDPFQPRSNILDNPFWAPIFPSSHGRIDAVDVFGLADIFPHYEARVRLPHAPVGMPPTSTRTSDVTAGLRVRRVTPNLLYSSSRDGVPGLRPNEKIVAYDRDRC